MEVSIFFSVPPNGWMVDFMENPNQTLMIWRYPYFRKPPIRQKRGCFYCLPSGFIKHGWLENSLWMEVLLGKSLISMVHFQVPCLISGGNSNGNLSQSRSRSRYLYCNLIHTFYSPLQSQIHFVALGPMSSLTFWCDI